MAEPTIPPEDEPRSRLLSLSHGFEFCVILVLFCAIGVVVLLAVYRLVLGIYGVITTPAQMAEVHAIQQLFGMIMTVLIALEFGNSIMRHLRERETIIQAREILLISMMALVRKIMLVDLSTEPPLTLVWLGIATLALAAAYWIMGQPRVMGRGS